MKLTNDEIAKVFAMYMPCDIDQDGLRVRKLVGIGGFDDLGYCYGRLKNKTGVATQFVNTFKLILTPIGKISDEVAVEVAKMMQIGIEHTENKSMHVYSILAMMFQMPITCGNDLLMGQFKAFEFVEIYQYLISQGVAVPLFFAPGHWANSKTAIELGIAINKLTNKEV